MMELVTETVKFTNKLNTPTSQNVCDKRNTSKLSKCLWIAGYYTKVDAWFEGCAGWTKWRWQGNQYYSWSHLCYLFIQITDSCIMYSLSYDYLMFAADYNSEFNRTVLRSSQGKNLDKRYPIGGNITWASSQKGNLHIIFMQISVFILSFTDATSLWVLPFFSYFWNKIRIRFLQKYYW